MKKNPAIIIFPFAFLALIAGILAGWQRIGWQLHVPGLAADHGALMTGSFIGTLICLERSIMHSTKWWRLLPLINGASILFFFLHQPLISYVLLITGSLGLLFLMSTYLLQSASISNILLIMGAFAWLTGNLVLFNQHTYPSAVKWWMLFLLWTILGERLELSRMLPVTRFKKWALYIVLVINLIGTLLPFHWNGDLIFSVSLLALSGWLLIFDMSRYAVKYAGQHRYTALWLLTGYGWLSIAALWLIFQPGAPFAYDAVLHSFFLGFVFSMIFAHVPIIFPGIFRMNISLYHPGLYGVFLLFQLSLTARIAGDAILSDPLRKWGAMINGISMLLFFIATITIIITRLNIRKHVNTGR